MLVPTALHGKSLKGSQFAVPGRNLTILSIKGHFLSPGPPFGKHTLKAHRAFAYEYGKIHLQRASPVWGTSREGRALSLGKVGWGRNKTPATQVSLFVIDRIMFMRSGSRCTEHVSCIKPKCMRK